MQWEYTAWTPNLERTEKGEGQEKHQKIWYLIRVMNDKSELKKERKRNVFHMK